MSVRNDRSGARGLPLWIAPCVVLLHACAVGPDYKGPPNAAPAAAVSPNFHRAQVAPVSATPPLANWWTALDDATLNRIVERALSSSPTLAAAAANVRTARAVLHQREAVLLPNGGAVGGGYRTHIPNAVADAITPGLIPPGGAPRPSSTVNLYDVGVDASWQIDIFGGTRRGIESAAATADYQQAELEDAQVTLTAEVARAYVNLRDRQVRLGLARDSVTIQQRMLELTRQRRAGGTIADGDVERMVTQIKQTEAMIPTLLAEIEVYMDQLAQLSGQEPGQLDAELADRVPVPVPPAETAVGDPAAFLRRRPDIRAAERQLAASNAQIGSAVAQYFPQVTLLGGIGYASTHSHHLIGGDTLAYAGGPTITWSILSFPAISAQVAAARAATEQADAAYRRTVLAALKDADNALSRFGHQRDDVVVLDEARTSAVRSADIARTRFQGGTISLIDMLDAERQRIQAEINLTQGVSLMTADWVSLQSSLGLGWGVGAAPPGARRAGLIGANGGSASSVR